MFDIIIEYKQALLSGFFTTFVIFLSAIALGMIGGVLLSYPGVYNKNIKYILDNIHLFVSSIPVIIFLYWLHYPLQEILGVNISPIYTVICMLGCINILGVYNIVSQKLYSIYENEKFLAETLGIEKRKITFTIEFPLLFRKSINELLSLEINILHMTLFASLIGVSDIFRVAHQINAVTYQTIEIYSLIGLVFLIISLLVNIIILQLRKKLNHDYSR